MIYVVGGLSLLAALLLAMLFADELVQFFVREQVVVDAHLPPGVKLLCAPRLVRILGFGAGGAAAVTIGRTILFPRDFADWFHNYLKARAPLCRAQRELLAHELAHVRQRERYGRWYLLVYTGIYLGLLLRHGVNAYEHHPLELEAMHEAGQEPHR